jgi:hypothetical protein
VNVSFSVTAHGRVLSWRLDLDQQDDQQADEQPPAQGGGFAGARTDEADTEADLEQPFGFAVPT